MTNFNYWKTKSGAVVKITEMTDEHIKNTIDFIEESMAIRRLEFDKLYSYSDGGQDDHISFVFECVEQTRGYKRLWKYLMNMEIEWKTRMAKKLRKS